MNLLSLEYFLMLVQEMNFTKASKKLFISQQALSKHIQNLEQDLDILLFDRNQPLTLTPAGKRLKENAEKILDLKKSAEREIKDIKDFKYGEVYVGVTDVRGSVILPRILPNFYENYPHVKVKLLEGTSKEIEGALTDGKIDLIIGFLPNQKDNITSEPLMKDRLCIVVPESIINKCTSKNESALYTENNNLNISLFKNCPFLKMPSSSWNGAIFEKYCRVNKFNPKVILETKNLGTLISLCYAGIGIIVCSEIFLNTNLTSNENQKNRVKKFYIDQNFFTNYTSISYLSNKYKTKAVEKFIEITKQTLYD